MGGGGFPTKNDVLNLLITIFTSHEIVAFLMEFITTILLRLKKSLIKKASAVYKAHKIMETFSSLEQCLMCQSSLGNNEMMRAMVYEGVPPAMVYLVYILGTKL